MSGVAVLLVAVAVVVLAGVRFYRARPMMTGVLQVRLPGGETIPIRLHNRRSVTGVAGDGTVAVRGLREDGAAKMRITWSAAGAADTTVLARGSTATMAAVDFIHQDV